MIICKGRMVPLPALVLAALGLMMMASMAGATHPADNSLFMIEGLFIP